VVAWRRGNGETAQPPRGGEATAPQQRDGEAVAALP
jgi:hypothetical protein